jgi:pimeloyl-ACP methyl ester carboxylesterase
MQTFAYVLLLVTQAIAATTPSKPAEELSGDTARWWREYPNGVRTIAIGRGRSLELFCQGKGSPAVILESGLGRRMFTWRKVQPALARRYRVCAYNRAGIAGSSFGPTPRDAKAIVSDLEKLVKRAQLRPPYILVGHSLGGFTVRLFARRNPRRTAGLVLVDPAVEGLFEGWAPIARADLHRGHLDLLQRCTARADAPDCRRWPLAPSLDDAPSVLRDHLLMRRPAEWRTMVSEMGSFAPGGKDETQIKMAGTDLKAVPLIVLTADWVPLQAELPPAQRRALLDEMIARHKVVARYSRRGIHKFVAGTSHDIQLDKPEAVITAVEQVALMARRSR